MFCSAYFILVPLCWNLTASLYHTILQVHKLQRWQTFSLLALSELVITKKVPYPIHYSLLINPKLFPFGVLRTDLRTKFSTPCSLSFFSIFAKIRHLEILLFECLHLFLSCQYASFSNCCSYTSLFTLLCPPSRNSPYLRPSLCVSQPKI